MLQSAPKKRPGTTSLALIGALVLLVAVVPALLAGSRAQIDAVAKTVDPEDEKVQQEAIEFAHKHAPELAKVLEELRTQKSAKFVGAIRGLLAEKRRLDRIQERFPDRYESELISWKRNAEVRRLTAKWTMSRDPEMERMVRALLLEEKQQRIGEMREEARKLRERLATLDAQIESFDNDQMAVVDAEWSRLIRRYSERASGRTRATDVRKPDAERDQPGKTRPTGQKAAGAESNDGPQKTDPSPRD